jgi:hypothetical protein
MSLANDFNLMKTTQLAALTRLHHGVPSGVAAQVADLGAILAKLDTARASSDTDPHLSADGKFAKAQSAVNAAQADIENWRATKTGGLDRQLATAQAALLARAGAAVPEPTPLQVSTMANQLADFDDVERQVLYAEANDEVQRVMEAASVTVGLQPVRRGDGLAWEPLITAESMAATVLARVERYDAAGAAQLRDLQRIRNMFASLAGSAKALVLASLPAQAA